MIIFSFLFLSIFGAQTAVTSAESMLKETTENMEPAPDSISPVDETSEEQTVIGALAMETLVTEEEKKPEEMTPYIVTGSESNSSGTPRKFFSICFDDGITQDLKIIDIFKKYGFSSCTFFINTGLYGANWRWVGMQYNRTDVKHIRFTKEELESGIYDGFDVAVHTLTHKSLKEYDNNPKAIRREVENDAENIYELTGVYPVGMAWPGGDNYVTETTKRLVFENTTIRFGRGITATHDFKLPEEFLMWQPTCSIIDADVLLYADRFIEAECSEDMLFFVWGHGYELDVYQIYDRLEELIKMITEADDIVCVTTTEFYQLFKDQIPSLK